MQGRRELARWVVAIAMLLPAIFPYLAHFRYARAHGWMPTGFLIRDMPYYMANARAHFAGGNFHLFYALPFSPYDSSPHIYFQPHTLLLALMWKLSGLEVHIVFMTFTVIAAIIGSRVAIALYETLVGLDTRGKRFCLPLFFWGGGVFVLAGAAKLYFAPDPAGAQFSRLFDLDPFGGWWFLYFGRNLLFGTEAYYHALFFGSILLALRKHFGASAIAAFALSISHPFTGIELLGVLAGWIVLERLILRTRSIPNGYAIAIAAIAAMHVSYYLWFLPHASPEHASVAHTWSAPFNLPWQSLLAAHGVVFLFALWTVRTKARWAAYFAKPSSRLLAMWFVVALVLSNHDLFIAPVQPLHFTRGYIWTPLFFIGAPSLVAMIEFLVRKRPLGTLAVAGFSILFLLDNLLWLTTIQYSPDVINDGMMITPDRWDVLQELRKPEYAGSLVLSRDLDLGYLVTAYTPLRSWYSHLYNTPFREERIEDLKNLFNNGVYRDEWRSRKTVVILRKDAAATEPEWLKESNGRLTKQDDTFAVYTIAPR